ncbi:hypothetical protein FACS189491_03370 [Spirochaetia bacterium]|nr:hypothetical protein FACS189491_03370 [Spirochaetia bacterium]
MGIYLKSDCLRRVHTPPLWGVIKGVDPETDTLPKQPYPVRSAAGLVDLLCVTNSIPIVINVAAINASNISSIIVTVDIDKFTF